LVSADVAPQAETSFLPRAALGSRADTNAITLFASEAKTGGTAGGSSNSRAVSTVSEGLGARTTPVEREFADLNTDTFLGFARDSEAEREFAIIEPAENKEKDSCARDTTRLSECTSVLDMAASLRREPDSADLGEGPWLENAEVLENTFFAITTPAEPMETDGDADSIARLISDLERDCWRSRLGDS